VDSDSQQQDQLTFVVQDAACFSQSAQREYGKLSFTLDFDKHKVVLEVIMIRCSKTSYSYYKNRNELK